jgi:hypothetical protein
MCQGVIRITANYKIFGPQGYKFPPKCWPSLTPSPAVTDVNHRNSLYFESAEMIAARLHPSHHVAKKHIVCAEKFPRYGFCAVCTNVNSPCWPASFSVSP